MSSRPRRRDLALRQRPALHHVVEVAAGNVLHHEHVHLAEGVEVVDGGDVRVIQLRKGERFLPEPPARLLIRDRRAREHLDGNITFEMFVAGAVDHPHSARVYLFDDAVVSQRPVHGWPLW
jgi:hypothetical protein